MAEICRKGVDPSVCRHVLLWLAFQNARPHKFEVPIPDVCAIFNALFPFFPMPEILVGHFTRNFINIHFLSGDRM